MRREIIEKNLKRALLEDGPFAQALFEYELEEHIEEYIQSKRADGDKYFSLSPRTIMTLPCFLLTKAIRYISMRTGAPY
jgi:hypothetical protein